MKLSVSVLLMIVILASVAVAHHGVGYVKYPGEKSYGIYGSSNIVKSVSPGVVVPVGVAIKTEAYTTIPKVSKTSIAPTVRPTSTASSGSNGLEIVKLPERSSSSGIPSTLEVERKSEGSSPDVLQNDLKKDKGLNLENKGKTGKGCGCTVSALAKAQIRCYIRSEQCDYEETKQGTLKPVPGKSSCIQKFKLNEEPDKSRYSYECGKELSLEPPLQFSRIMNPCILTVCKRFCMNQAAALSNIDIKSCVEKAYKGCEDWFASEMKGYEATVSKNGMSAKHKDGTTFTLEINEERNGWKFDATCS